MILDYDLSACLEYNPQNGINNETVVDILAVWEGENDGDDWRWVVALTDGTFAFIQGGCDYTGWDCQSWAVSTIIQTPEQAAFCALGQDVQLEELFQPVGFGHMMSMLTGSYMGNREEVFLSLWEQLGSEKDETWRERKDKEFGIS